MLSLRNATLDDAPTLVAFNAAMAWESEGLTLDPAVLEAGVRRVLTDEVGAFYRLAEREGKVVGQLMVTAEWSDWRDAWVWWIQSVYVVPQARRSGIYTALHQSVVEDARARGVAGVRLYVDARNRSAMATYRALGMNGDHYRVFEQMFSAPRGAR